MENHHHQSDPHCARGCHDDGHGHCHCHHHHHEEGGGLAAFWREGLSGLLMLAGVLLAHFGVLKDEWLLTLYIPAVIPVGIPVVVDAWKCWKRGDFMNEFTLMLAAALGAFLIGEYPEAVAVLLFYSFGERLEHKASDDVKRRVKALLGRLPSEARVEKNGKIIGMNPDEVEPGEFIVVRPGERVPIDAKLQGDHEIEFDTSAITGESVPRSYKPGEEVMSGMIPIDRDIRLQTTKAFTDSSLSRIMKMIEEAGDKKSPTETMLRRITRWYTPLVFVLALFLFVVPWIVSLVNPDFDFVWFDWFRRSLIFLVCSCPCALVVSIPLSYFTSIGSASRRGLLFKGSGYLDTLLKVDTVALDKTGTITTGEFHISGINPAAGANPDELLAIAAAIDAESAHPLAKAILKEAASRKLDLPKAVDVQTVPHGMTGKINGRQTDVGSARLMDKLGISVPAAKSDATLIYVARDGKFVGTIELLDTIKPEAKKAMERLHKFGVKRIIVLSGDRKESVARVAREIGADEYEAELLPADKRDFIERQNEQDHRTLFAGDGINDAPAIATADVGVAMGTMGTGMAMETSDVVIAGDSLNGIADAMELARRVRITIIENVIFALGVKALVMGLGAFGIATLWAAVFADTGVTLITILWTLLSLSFFGRKKK